MSEEYFISAMNKTRQVSNAKIMSARTKPDGVSDVRWRIELRRRAQRYWSSWIMCVAHAPDKLR